MLYGLGPALFSESFPLLGAADCLVWKGGMESLNLTSRSEERRVGKECSVVCRSRWSPYH